MKKQLLFFLFCFISLPVLAVNTIEEPPTISISYSASAFCQSAPPQLPILEPGSIGGIFTYTTTGINNTLYMNPATGEIDPLLSSVGEYIVTLTIPSSPGNPSMATSTSVQIISQPTATIISSSGNICQGSTSELIIIGTPNAIVTYNINGGAIQTLMISPFGQTVVATGILTQSIVANLISVTMPGNWCTTYLANTTTINVIPIANPQLSNGEVYVVNDVVTQPLLLDCGVTGNYTYQWFLNGELIPDATGSTYLVNTFSTSPINQYMVVVSSVAAGCMPSSAQCTVTQSVLGNTEFNLLDLKYSPNPFNETITIQSKENLKNVMVYNLLGQEVYNVKMNAMSVNLDLSNLSSGNYIVKVESDSKQKIFKAIKN